MRYLYLRRVRALVAFGYGYQVFLDRDRDHVLELMSRLEGDARVAPVGDITLKNGEGVKLPIPEEGMKLFAALCLEHYEVASEEVIIPPGTEDVYYDLITVAQYNRRMKLELAPRPPEETGGN